MKKAILTLLAVTTFFTARAQLFNPDSVGGALWGGLLGGVLGGDCRHGFSGNGAAIGAGIGFLAGSLAHESNRRAYYYSQPYVYTPEATVSVGYGYTPYANSTYLYYAPNTYCAPRYYYHRERRLVYQPTVVEPVRTVTVIPAPQRSQVTSRPSPTSTYHWTARPQIADAPRVPDAPTF